MEQLDVNDLKNYKSGSRKSLATKAYLEGILTIVTSEEEEYPRGTILLQDFMAKNPVVCLIDRMLPQLLNITVCIKRWNFIDLNEGSDSFYIEFRLVDIYRPGIAKGPWLEEQLASDRAAFQLSLKRQTEHYTPGNFLKNRSPQAQLNMTGIVYAISILYLTPNTPAMFFLQLTDTNKSNGDDSTIELRAINLIFSGDDLLKYYRYFQIGGAFAFHNLDIKTINRGDRHSFHVLSFNSKSTCLAITYTQFSKIHKQPDASSISEHPLTLINVYKHKTYTGLITRVIDSMFGIYELDGKITISLFHLFSYSAETPFRVGTRVRLHHFHAIIVNPEDSGTSYLLEYVWRATKTEIGYMVLAGCTKSYVEILQFPQQHHCQGFTETTSKFFLQNPTDAIETKLKEDIFIDVINRKSTFTQLLRQLEIYAALTVKFMDTNIVKDFDVFQRAFKAIRDHVFATTQTGAMMSKGDLVVDFILHDMNCLLIGPEVFTVMVDVYPSLDRIKSKLQDSLTKYHLDLAGGSTMFEKENVLTERAEYEQTTDYYILGVLEISRDGRMYLMDNKSRILCKVAASPSSRCKAGEIYLVRRLQMFREDLSYIEDTDKGFIERKDLYISYIVCQDKDLLLVDGKTHYNSNVFYIRNTADLDNRVLSKLSLYRIPQECYRVSNDHQYVAVHVITQYPVEVFFTSSGCIYLESRVVVEIHEIEGIGCAPDSLDYIKFTGSRKCVLVFSSLKGTLHFHLDFQVDSRWVIYGLDKPESQIKGTARNSSLVFLIDADKHTVYPISNNQDILNMIQLEPHFSKSITNTATKASNSVSLIYNVSDVANLDNLPSGITRHTIPGNFFEQLVHVQGVVIIKRFTEELTTNSILHRHALKIYNHLGVGTGKASRKLFVQLRQPDGLETINIYMDVHKVQYPLGMVIGSTVTFHNLIRKMTVSSNEEFYFLANSATYIEINNAEPSASIISMKPAPIATRLISSFLDPVLGTQQELNNRQIFKLYCYVTLINNFCLKWECRDCGSIVRNNECYGMCQGASRVFSANAYVQITDGTANAYAAIDGERLIFRLLQLSAKQIDSLKNLVLHHGQLSYSAWDTNKTTTMINEEEEANRILNRDFEKKQRNAMHGYTLEDLCNNAKRAGQFYLYGHTLDNSSRKRSRDNDLSMNGQDLIDEFKLRKFKISDNGSLLKTAELPKLKVKTIEIVFPDARMVAFEMLNSLNQTEDPTTVESVSSSMATLDLEQQS